jgi:hypothetical protein
LNSIAGIYDFELFPYALGDVLTWNIRTAMRCEELGRATVDIYICLDKRYCAGIFQRDLVNSDNFELFFSELYTAFGTHPRLGNIFIFRNRETLFERLLALAKEDSYAAESIEEYLLVLEYSEKHKKRLDIIDAVRKRLDPIMGALKAASPKKARDTFYDLVLPGKKVIKYFEKYIHSHDAINTFFYKNNRIPLLERSVGCEADVEEFQAQCLKDKAIVLFHMRLRRLDVGYGGESSYDRDSDFFEWFDFLNSAASRYPDVVFIALGRLQEKPLALLDLPNVVSLRAFGMGLGHELTLMQSGDLFIGSSSGFAACANFSKLPYFITNMNLGACNAYAIPEGGIRLPFAFPDQELVYEKETSLMLMTLLERGLRRTSNEREKVRPEKSGVPKSGNEMIDVQAWREFRLQPVNKAATTSRFQTDKNYQEAETGFLLQPVLQRISALKREGHRAQANQLLMKVEANFPELCPRLKEFVSLVDTQSK